MDCLDDLLIGADGGSLVDVEVGTNVTEVGIRESVESKATGEESEWREET